MQFCGTKEIGKEDHNQKKERWTRSRHGTRGKRMENPLEFGTEKFSGKHCKEQPKAHCKSTVGGSAQLLNVLWVACWSFQVADILLLQQLLWTVLLCSRAHLSGDRRCTHALGNGSSAAITKTHENASKYLLNWDRHQCHSTNPKQKTLHTYMRLIFSICKTDIVALETW